MAAGDSRCSRIRNINVNFLRTTYYRRLLRFVPHLNDLGGHMLLTEPRIPSIQHLAPLRDKGTLAANNIIVVNGSIEENNIFIHPHFQRLTHAFSIDFSGRDNSIYLGANSGILGFISFYGDSGSAIIIGDQHFLNLHGAIYSNGKLTWGSKSPCYGIRLWVHGGRSLTIGENCLFSEGITMRTSDHHSVIDLHTGRATNMPSDVRIGRHVWLGPEVSVSKGVTIGDGSILGARSLVLRDVPDRELWAGVPATRRRQNVSWVESFPAAESHIAQLSERFALTEREPYPNHEVQPPKENLG